MGRFASSRFSPASKMLKGSFGSGVGIRAPGVVMVGTGFGLGTPANAAPVGLLSGSAPAAACAGTTIPENFPAQPRQYFARSRFATWQEAQYFVMAMKAVSVTQRIGMNGAAITSSRLIATEKAANGAPSAGPDRPWATRGRATTSGPGVSPCACTVAA